MHKFSMVSIGYGYGWLKGIRGAGCSAWQWAYGLIPRTVLQGLAAAEYGYGYLYNSLQRLKGVLGKGLRAGCFRKRC